MSAGVPLAEKKPAAEFPVLELEAEAAEEEVDEELPVGNAVVVVDEGDGEPNAIVVNGNVGRET